MPLAHAPAPRFRPPPMVTHEASSAIGQIRPPTVVPPVTVLPGATDDMVSVLSASDGKVTPLNLRLCSYFLITRSFRRSLSSFFFFSVIGRFPNESISGSPRVADIQIQLRSRECDLFLLEKEVGELRTQSEYDFPTS